MKNIIIKIKKLWVVCLLPAAILTGCNLFGLDVQQSYDYDYSAGMRSNELHCTVWEFLQARKTDYRIFLEGIEYAGLQNMYNEPNATYIVLRNSVFTNTTTGFFLYNPLINVDGAQYTPNTLLDYPKETVRQLLLYHIVKGAWTWSNLPFGPTWYPTYANGETAFVNMFVAKTVPPNIQFNNFPGHYVQGKTARTTNLKASNGSYVHVLDDAYLMQPSIDLLK